jgi:hypothetical protein
VCCCCDSSRGLSDDVDWSPSDVLTCLRKKKSRHCHDGRRQNFFFQKNSVADPTFFFSWADTRSIGVVGSQTLGAHSESWTCTCDVVCFESYIESTTPARECTRPMAAAMVIMMPILITGGRLTQSLLPAQRRRPLRTVTHLCRRNHIHHQGSNNNMCPINHCLAISNTRMAREACRAQSM